MFSGNKLWVELRFLQPFSNRASIVITVKLFVHCRGLVLRRTGGVACKVNLQLFVRNSLTPTLLALLVQRCAEAGLHNQPHVALFVYPWAQLNLEVTKVFIIITRIRAFDVEPRLLIVNLQHTEDDVSEGGKLTRTSQHVLCRDVTNILEGFGGVVRHPH